ncbi:MAG: bifunctional adenosylcobinamide kinase/adenosylcobinamide-phosphate guanylyltransferase [Oscillospiraceae bacterium]|nr:bifunctional adenosylcobinamide kinase/adenosylcobinamide-phosphate guanylyltransferase [Oscillospiraceae bacterium]
MTALVIGGSKCGKSGYAESLLEGVPGQRCYLATMEPFGEEAQHIITRHRLARAGKGFVTLECPRDLGGLTLPPGCSVLLEDLGNLCANEMFRADGVHDPLPCIRRGIDALRRQCRHLVMVSNDVGYDLGDYPPETGRYLCALGAVNAYAASVSDLVTECVFGIPIVRKGEAPCSGHF